MRDQTKILISPVFLTALAILLLNDFLLKGVFHNWLTGKLSDFSGLFVFCSFLSVFAPTRTATAYTMTAVGFAFWKSSYSQALIDAANTVLPFNIGRTVDMSDLLALLVLPVSWVFANRAAAGVQYPNPSRIRSAAICAICVFAFAATSSAQPEHKVPYNKDYLFESSPTTLIKQLNELRQPIIPQEGAYEVFLAEGGDCNASSNAWATVRVYPRPSGKSRLRLESISYLCEEKEPGDSAKLEEFETLVVNRLRSRDR